MRRLRGLLVPAVVQLHLVRGRAGVRVRVGIRGRVRVWVWVGVKVRELGPPRVRVRASSCHNSTWYTWYMVQLHAPFPVFGPGTRTPR